MAVVAGKDGNQIRLRLTHHTLDQLPFFNAISYSVGPDKPSRECVCDYQTSRGIITITDNLWDALWQFRNEREDFPLWCDQVSTDQTDPVEKAQQIRLMSNIYSRASKVLVWLGKADSETEVVYSLLRNLEEQFSKVVEQIGTVNSARTMSSFLRYFDTLRRHPSMLRSADAPE